MASSTWSKTFGYVGTAAACLAVTGFAELFNGTPEIKEFGKVGTEFYEEFTDPTVAAELEVFVFDQEAVRAREFKVARQENGLWTIPSHHDYPADAEERLGKTAASIIGIKRGAMVTRWNADHALYGVINPKKDALSVEDVEGVGQRLILRKDDDSVLADYIIGKEVEGRTGEYYVRHPEEDEVYIANLEIDLSTSFTDWIDDKLFTFSNGDVVDVTVNDYVFNGKSVSESVVSTLRREEAWGDNWDLEGLNTETQEINVEKVNATLTALSDLEVIGVRPKQKGLTPELQLDREYLTQTAQLNLLQQDLFASGFVLQPTADPEVLSLISREGELLAGTNNGLRYQLYFGSIFTGSQEELEIGFGDNSPAATDDSESETAAPDATDPSSKPGRFLFVRVAFDEALIPGPKSAPVEPEKPAKLSELEAAESTDSQADEPSTDDAEATGEGEEETPSELETLRTAYETALEQFKTDQRDFETRQEKITESKATAEEFNRRFAEWYYVIASESFDKLKLTRADMVKAKEIEAEESATDPAATVPPVAPFVPPTADTSEAPFNEASDEAENDASESSEANEEVSQDASEPEITEEATEEPTADPVDEAAGSDEAAEVKQAAENAEE